jgi:hypothetical protein
MAFKISEIAIEDLPLDSKHGELYQDILLRLEQTGPGFALQVECDNEKEAASALNALRKAYRRRLGPSVVALSAVDNYLFAWRGTNWDKRSYPVGNGAKDKRK